MTHLIPPEGRGFFYRIVEIELKNRSKLDPKESIESQSDDFFGLEQYFSILGLAALDLQLPATSVQHLFAESGVAGMLAVRGEEDVPPIDQLKTFFGLFLAGDAKRLVEHSEKVVEIGSGKKRSEDPHVQGLALALAASVLDDSRLVKAALGQAAQAAAKITKPRSRQGWAVSMNALAEAALLSKPVDLSAGLKQVAQDTRAWFGRASDIEDQNFESYLARMPLAFAARARARGFKLPKTNPHPCMVMSILELEPMKPLTHPWHKFSQPDAKLVKAFAKALALEDAEPAKGKH